MSAHDTVIEPIAAAPELEPAVIPAPAARRRRWVAYTGYAGLVWLAVYAMLAGDGRSMPAAMGTAILLTGIWLVTLQQAISAARLHTFSTGVGGATLLGSALGVAASSALAVWVPTFDLEPLSLLAMGAAIALLTTAWRAFLSEADKHPQRILIVGAGRGTADLLETLAQEQKHQFEPIGIVDDLHVEDALAGVPIRGRIRDLPWIVQEERPDLVVVTVERNRPEVFKNLLEVGGSGFNVVGLPEFYEHSFGRVPVRHLTAAWFMSVLHLYQRPYSRFAKRTFDVLVAGVALVLVAPLIPILVLLVRQTKGPVIFRQTRLGEDGRHYTILKLRTMQDDAEEPGTPLWAEERDPRITFAGRFLRRTRLDEVPQLWNVLRGDMSIVGPRPERPEFLPMLEEAVPFWTRRHLLKPGITGWAQIRNGYTADALGTEEKLSYDLWYLRHRSLLVDAIICCKTLPKLLSGWGAR
jgi:exopolysaccharide biosynthesis polyprenyl glycosylphosphotransferase